MRHLIITFLLSSILSTGLTQPLPYVINFIASDGANFKSIEGNADSLKFIKKVATEYKKLVKKGHILASVNKHYADSLMLANIDVQDVFAWGTFNIDYVPEVLLSRAGYQKKQFNNTRISPRLLGDLMVKIIEESDKTGYPFAKVQLDSVIINKEEISAVLKYSSGQKITYGPIELNTDFINTKYLVSYLTLKEGDVFNSQKLMSVDKKINNLPYCKTSEVPKIRFENKNCIVSLNIEPVKANMVDAMVGFAPNQIDNTKLLATGYVNLDLQNLFKSGKRLTFKWRQFGVQSQTLKASYNHTNLFGSPINIEGRFDLFKQDTLFINRNFHLNIGLDQASYTINFTSRFISSRLLSPTNASGIENLELIDFNGQYYGIELMKYEFDSRINPRRGWSISTGINIGAKNILNTSFVPSEVYDSLKIQTLQATAQIAFDFAVPISKLFVAYSKFQFGSVANNGELFTNDLFRLGGINSIRGFNELEIYSSTYAMIQIEGRLLLSENSRLFGFVDWAYSENQVLNYTDTFLGVGAGLLLDTSYGVVQLVYAVGNSSNESLSLAESKIHVGYVARF